MGSIFPQNKWTGLPRYHDPWFRAEQWRYEHPVVAMKYNWRRVVPGFGYGAVAFAAYCVVEWAFFGGGGHGHGHGGHGGHQAKAHAAADGSSPADATTAPAPAAAKAAH